MQTTITARHMELTEAMRNYAEKKVNRLLNKYKRISDIEIVIDNDGGVGYKIDLIIKVGHHQRFAISNVDKDAYACLDGLIDKGERQLVKQKEKSHNHKGKTGATEATAEVLEAKDMVSEEE